MDTQKEFLMNQTYRQFLNTGFGLNSADNLDAIADDKLMGFGTTVDEKVLNLTQLKELLARQQEQSNGLDLRWEIKPLSHYTSDDENTAFFADDLFLNATINGEAITMYLRFSVVLSYVNDQWKVIHWHGSKPENVQSEEDTFGIETWRQKAEALEKLVAERTADLVEKNRELEIETSLERVRAVAMSMHRPDDMLQVCSVISEQFELLSIKAIRNVQTAIFYPEKGTYMNYEYYAKHHKTFITETTYGNNEKHAAFAEDMQKGAGQFFELAINGDEVKDWIAYQKTTNVFIDDFLYDASSLNYYWCSLGQVAFGMSTYEPLQESGKELFKRFSKVFELAYRRYLDIEKAEAQAQEARIETALERVRAVAMAMKQSEELITVCEVMYKELLSLGFTNIRNAQIAIENDVRQSYAFYVYSDFEKITGGEAGYHSSPIVQRLYTELGKSGDGLYEREYSSAEMEEWRDWRKSLSPLLDAREETVASLCWYMYAIGKGNIGISTFNALTDEQVEIVKRFKKVFELSYRRFDDLQKAEAQTRESQIQLALERVRARTMAMHKSDELIQTAELLFEQLRQLGAESQGVAFAICDKDSTMVKKWTSIGVFSVPYTLEPGEQRMYEAWKNQTEIYEEVYEGEKLKKYYELFMEIPAFKEGFQKFIDKGHALPVLQKNHAAIFKHGYLLIITSKPFTETQIFLRFAKVFEQTYTRFLDLQKSEAQTRESQIELSLERVRAKTMAMHNSADVGETAAVMVEELKKLGIETIRCGIGIMHEPGNMEVWTISTDEDNKTSIIIGWLDMNMHPLLHGAFESWRKKIETYSYELRDDDLLAYYNAINNYPGYPIRYDTSDLPMQIHHNEFHFTEGTLFAFSLQQLTDEQRKIFSRFAGVFGQTYRRYLDLKKAEAQALRAGQDLLEIKAARQRAEAALNELQITQKQLIQSEKMASLGELTAGIAHEIQNPLNFVNNFSEVSNELLDEMMEELATGNWKLATEIAGDVKQNLEKINHHGRRADGIVKGMLQHSRQTSTAKELTDVNALCDEYLRLAYHGLRAKDKSFNATLKTDFDKSIGNINIIPQDIGRVILNLITNAFYAIDEKKKQPFKEYEPTVSITTKKVADKVEIKVTDNGNGIPQNIVDKIFQPFFTTKPTGQGTGLGLSLAYDMVKAHGGELKVATKEGTGTEFTIQLPIA